MLMLVILLGGGARAQVSKDLEKADFDFIDSLHQIDRGDARGVEGFFLRNDSTLRREKLGFGWSSMTAHATRGYLVIHAEFYYYKDSIETYVLHSYFPTDERLTGDYEPYFSKLFTTREGLDCSYVFRPGNILRPLQEYYETGQTVEVTQPLLHYMAPGWMHSSRLIDDKKSTIAIGELMMMMYSINPTSRLTAIQLYLKRTSPAKVPASVKYWIERALAEI